MIMQTAHNRIFSGFNAEQRTFFEQSRPLMNSYWNDAVIVGDNTTGAPRYPDFWNHCETVVTPQRAWENTRRNQVA